MEVLFDLIIYPSEKDGINLIDKRVVNLNFDKRLISIILDENRIILRTDEYVKMKFLLDLITKDKKLVEMLNYNYSSILQITSFEADFFNNVNYEIHFDLIELLYLLRIGINFTYSI